MRSENLNRKSKTPGVKEQRKIINKKNNRYQENLQVCLRNRPILEQDAVLKEVKNKDKKKPVNQKIAVQLNKIDFSSFQGKTVQLCPLMVMYEKVKREEYHLMQSEYQEREARRQPDTSIPLPDQYTGTYIEDILANLKASENKSRGDPLAFQRIQREVVFDMRSIVVDWLVSVHWNFNLTPSTLFLAINIYDRFLSLKEVSKQNLQLTGLGSLLIAAKHDEVSIPKLQDLVFSTDGACSTNQLIEMEIQIIFSLGFTISGPTVYTFLSIYAY